MMPFHATNRKLARTKHVGSWNQWNPVRIFVKMNFAIPTVHLFHQLFYFFTTITAIINHHCKSLALICFNQVKFKYYLYCDNFEVAFGSNQIHAKSGNIVLRRQWHVTERYGSWPRKSKRLLGEFFGESLILFIFARTGPATSSIRGSVPSKYQTTRMTNTM